MAQGINPFVARRTEPGALGEKLRKARKERGLTQAELGELAGLDQTTVSKVEKGGRLDPSLSTIVALERALNISLGAAEIHPSLVRFLASPMGQRLQIQAREADELAVLNWWSGPGEPDDDEWYEFVRLRRSVLARCVRK
jgi:transcriptional regulator with XRE-family HTH domain